MPSHYSQMGGYAAQNSLNYGPSSYYGQMDYMSSMQLPVMTSVQAMTGSGVSPHGNFQMSHMGAYGLPSAATMSTQQIARPNTTSPDCSLGDYEDSGAWPKFQAL